MMANEGAILHALLDSWDRNNIILRNLLRVLPEETLELKPTVTSHSIAELFAHMHYCRLVFVLEAAPECATPVPEDEWRAERDRDRLSRLLDESAATVRHAVSGRLRAGRAMDQHYDHPILMLQHLIWHEGYHHGQVKLTLQMAGYRLDDEVAGPLTWDVWIEKRTGASAG